MFTVRKLLSLPPRTRLRKLVHILQEAERQDSPDLSFFSVLAKSTAFRDELPPELSDAIDTLQDAATQSTASSRLRSLNSSRHIIQRYLGMEPAEWDLLDLNDGTLEARKTILPVRVYLEDIRSPYNVGSIFRTAEAFGVREILLSRDTPSPAHRRAQRTARGCTETMPWRRVSLNDLDQTDQLFALETGGTPLQEFSFFPEGIVLLGSEELGLSPRALELADEGRGRVSIPMAGSKRSLNVAVAFGILMWMWYSRVTADS